MLATENDVRARSQPSRPSSLARSGSIEEVGEGGRERRHVAGLDEDARPAVDDDLGDGAHPRRDDREARRASPRAARSRTPPSARCGRTRRRARASRGSRAGRGGALRRRGRSSATSRARLLLERTAAEDREHRLRVCCADGGERSAAASRDPSERSGGRSRAASGASGRTPELGGRHLGWCAAGGCRARSAP